MQGGEGDPFCGAVAFTDGDAAVVIDAGVFMNPAFGCHTCGKHPVPDSPEIFVEAGNRIESIVGAVAMIEIIHKVVIGVRT